MIEEHQYIRKFIDTLVLVVSSFAGVLVFVKGYTLLFVLAIVLQYGAFISYATRLRGTYRDNQAVDSHPSPRLNDGLTPQRVLRLFEPECSRVTQPMVGTKRGSAAKTRN